MECSALGSWWFGFRKQLGDSSIGISKRKHWQYVSFTTKARSLAGFEGDTQVFFQESLEGHRKDCVRQYWLVNNSDWRRKERCYRSWMAPHSKPSALNNNLGSVLVTLLQYVQPTEQIPGPDILSGISLCWDRIRLMWSKLISNVIHVKLFQYFPKRITIIHIFFIYILLKWVLKMPARIQ